MTRTSAVLSCPRCGATADPSSSRCDYCQARLATVGCPHCFALIFQEYDHCPYCGETVARAEVGPSERCCPRCQSLMRQVALGRAQVDECSGCNGLWLDSTVFDRVCVDREEQSSVLGRVTHAPPEPNRSEVRYLPCPSCDQLMNRVNFAKVSGVIVDVCKPHGVWLDQDELRRIVTFIQQGGMKRARERERTELAQEKRKLSAARIGGAMDHGVSEPSSSRWGVWDAVEMIFDALGTFLS